MTFTINRKAILEHPRTQFIHDLVPIHEYLDNIERFINECFDTSQVVQSGRVIALRATDADRLSSAFKAAMYLGKYADMDNIHRFLKGMVAADHSYEPIRGENVLFLYLGVSKVVYDHLTTHHVGRYTRIAGGQRANKPWGFEVPVEAKNPELYFTMNIPRIRQVLSFLNKDDNEEGIKEQIQAMRSSLPVGYIMPPFLLEFSEEALIGHVLRRRLFESGVQGATAEIALDMWNCLTQLDKEKWEFLQDYNGSHIKVWEKVMRTLRDNSMTVDDLINDLLKVEETTKAHDALVDLFGKMPKSMWDKQK